MVQPGLTGSTGIRSAAQSRSPPLNRKQQPSGQLSSPIFCTRQVLVNLCQANALMQTLQNDETQVTYKICIQLTFWILTQHTENLPEYAETRK